MHLPGRWIPEPTVIVRIKEGSDEAHSGLVSQFAPETIQFSGFFFGGPVRAVSVNRTPKGFPLGCIAVW